MGASIGFSEEHKKYRTRTPILVGGGTAIGRMLVERGVVHIDDAATDPEYTDASARGLGQVRTVLSVPLFRDDAIVGGVFLACSRVQRFTEKQIALVSTFADQAVIAMENARLITETRKALDKHAAPARRHRPADVRGDPKRVQRFAV
jgi:two-component system NtrC family sensor kinase